MGKPAYRTLTGEIQRDEAAARRRNAAAGPVGRIGESGRRDMAIPMDAFMRGLRLNGPECFESKEFCDDMVKRHPHLAVPQRDGRFFSLAARVGSRPRAVVKALFAVRDGELVQVYERK